MVWGQSPHLYSQVKGVDVDFRRTKNKMSTVFILGQKVEVIDKRYCRVHWQTWDSNTTQWLFTRIILLLAKLTVTSWFVYLLGLQHQKQCVSETEQTWLKLDFFCDGELRAKEERCTSCCA